MEQPPSFEEMELWQKVIAIIVFIALLGIGAWLRKKAYKNKYKP